MACAVELAQGKPTRKHIEFALGRVRMLIHFGIKPYLVFDGGYLPSKAHTEKDRAARRKESKRIGLDLLRMGKPSQAYLELQKAVDVTPMMARELIEELKRLDVPYVVAPYEADSQLAYLEKQGHISGVLSEDSDLLVFGVKCLLTKLDQYGECVMVNKADFTACREISLVGWTDAEFRIMAMLSGCDYLPGIDKMGLKTAYRLVRKHKVVDRIVRSVQFDGKMKVPAGYLEAFAKAEQTFLYQWVYCPEARCLVNLNKVPQELDLATMPYVGRHLEPKIAVGVATAELDPNTKERLIISHLTRVSHPSRSNSVRQTPDEKQGKPISEFFKAKRTPLAELDPNSFAASPSQQQLLQSQHGLSWSASQAPGTQPAPSSRAPSTSRSSSAPQANRQSANGSWPDRLRASPKRQRLCSETLLAASMDGALGVESATSRFFSKQTAQPSPSLRKTSRKKDEFELWSDDSAADAVAALTATPEEAPTQQTPSPKKRKKLKVFPDPEPQEQDAQSPADDLDTTQDTVTTTFSPKSPNTYDDETPDTSFEESNTPESSTVLSKAVAVDFSKFKSRFSFPGRQLTSSSLRTSSAPLLSKASSTEVTRKELLSRLEAVSKSSDAPIWSNLWNHNDSRETSKAEVPASSPMAAPVDGPDIEDDIPDDEWLAMEHQELHTQPAQPLHGSEDLLIPNSPESGGEPSTRSALNLGRFTFAG